MAGLHDLSAGGYFADRDKRQRAMETAAPLRNASIGAGGLRVHSGGMITIENGGLRVTGTAEIIGRLVASGTIEFSGEVTISGPLDITGLTQIMGDLILQAGGKFTAGTIELNPDGSAKFGTLTIDPTGKLTSGQATINPDGSAKFGQFDIAANGNLDSKGTLDIKGKSTLQDDLEVKGGGKVKVGGMTLDPIQGGGSLRFESGAYLFSNSGVTSFGAGGDAVDITLSNSSAQIRGTRVVLNGQLSNPAYASASADTKPNMYMDANGNIKRINPG